MSMGSVPKVPIPNSFFRLGIMITISGGGGFGAFGALGALTLAGFSDPLLDLGQEGICV